MPGAPAVLAIPVLLLERPFRNQSLTFVWNAAAGQFSALGVF